MRWLGGITGSVDVGLGPHPTPGVGDGQGGLACCSLWGRRESDTTERLNWLNWVTYLNSLCLNFLNKMWEIIGLTHRVLAGSNWVNMCEILSSWYLTCVLCGSISMTLFITIIIHSLIKYLLIPSPGTKIPCAAGQLSLCATSAEPSYCNKRSHMMQRSFHRP